MKWAIKHKSGRTLFVTSDEFIANNRRKMGWIVEGVKMTSREQFEEWIKSETGFDLWRTEYPMTDWDSQQYRCHQTNLAWMAWQASRAAIEINLPETEVGYEMIEYYTPEAVVKAIEQEGLEVKK